MIETDSALLISFARPFNILYKSYTFRNRRRATEGSREDDKRIGKGGEINASVTGDRVRSPLTVFHLHTGRRGCGGEKSAFHVLARFTSARSSLEAASPSSGAYLQPHRPGALVTSATSLAVPPDHLDSPSRVSLPSWRATPPLPPARATAPSPPCRIQMSLFSGPLRSPFTQPCAVTRRGRGREKDYGGWLAERGSERDSIRAPSTDTLCPNERAVAFSRAAGCSRNHDCLPARDEIA